MSKYNKLAGKHVLVIGGSNGIGRGVVEAAIEAGAHVTISASTPRSAETAVSQLKTTYPEAQVTGLSCDLSKDTVEQDLENLFQQAEQHGKVDHVVLTACDGLAIYPLGDVTLDKLQRAGHFRFVVPVLLAKVAARHLPRTRESSITLTTGGAAEHPMKDWSLVTFMCGGMPALARNLALDMAPVRVNAVMPGFVDTGLWEGTITAEEKNALIRSLEEKLPGGKAGEVEDVAEAYIYLMKDRNSTGETVATRSGGHLV